MLRAAHIVVVALFALLGLSRGLVGIVEVAGVKGAGVSETPGQSRSMQIVDGCEDCAFGAVYLITAVGIFKFNRLVRFLAIILLLLNLFGALSNNLADLSTLSWLLITVLVFVWFFLAPVRAQFAVSREQAKIA